ncbi:hypothetical protein ACH4YO_28415 [Streptomyces noursei]|uniref:hypothetical protein n=1 Tax=Streptomyces noursei TaxID=1971 RepID=UPI0033C97E80
MPQELLWPPLLSRVDLEADGVLRMQAQHERVEATLTRLAAAVPAWAATAGADERDTLVANLADHRAGREPSRARQRVSACRAGRPATAAASWSSRESATSSWHWSWASCW